jgi:predicted nucleotidyltransferase
LATLRLRDRDAIATKEGLIFRVLGYSHPAGSYICDVEYASERIFRSNNPKALRNGVECQWYKFFENEGLQHITRRFPQYLIFDDMLQKQVVGVERKDIFEVRKPEEKLHALLAAQAKDDLLKATQDVVDGITKHTGLDLESLGVFGCMLHDFYHPKYSDIDLMIYGQHNTLKLCETLKELYESSTSALSNEFATVESVKGKPWHFQNFSLKEYWWHQRRKLIYSIFNDKKSGRRIKTEFEPAKEWKEISNDYDLKTRIRQINWVKVLAEVKEDNHASFVPSIYGIEPREVIKGPRETLETIRIISYVEEFRKQATIDEVVYAEGNLEEVTTAAGSFYQIVLTYCPRYYEQTLKVVDHA